MDIKLRDSTRGEGEGILPDQLKVVVALLEQPTVGKAAKAAHIGKTTLYRWLREDTAFKDPYSDARRETFSSTVARLQTAASQAVDTLVEVAEDQNQQGAARVGANKAILEFAVKAIEHEDIAARIDALEQAGEEK